MKNSFSSFLLKTGAIAVLVSALFTFLLPQFIAPFYSSVAHSANVFIWLVTLGVHYFLLKKSEGRTQSFIPSFMLTTTLKLLLFFLVLLGYSFLNRDKAVFFIVVFFVLYFFYSFIEVLEILKFLKGKKGN